MTASQRRAAAAQAYNAYLATCPARDLLDTLSDKWVALVVSALADAGGTQRFSELRRTIAGVSQKMLTQTLRQLERDGVLERTVLPTVPPRTDYELTALGWELVPLLAGIKRWADTHVDAIAAARETYDSRPAAAA